jgi:GMP synthase (glutamine-hydrolysing)
VSDPIKKEPAAGRILILRTGHTDPEVIRHHGDYDRWITDTMAGMECRFTVHHVPDRGMPDLRGHDGVVVTGTTASVMDRAAWMAELGETLAGAGGDAPPVLAVCFAAQLAADALGGRVERNPRGWEIGTVTVELTEAGRDDPLFRGLPPVLEVQATHQDHIAELPAEATLLAGNRKAPVQAFAHGTRLRAVQFHPEAGAGILRRLITLRREILEEDARRQGAPEPEAARLAVERLRASVRESGHGRQILANWLREFVLGA